MSRLIVASNRVGDFASGFQAGGLAVALCSMLRTRGGLWFGAEEVEQEDTSPSAIKPERAPGTDNVELCKVPVGKQLYSDYYLGFANSVLWPVFHNRLDLAGFDNDFYDAYREVNARFADAIAESVRPNDTIWVHDYHLITVGEELRKRGVENAIGFFLHIPFPNGEVLASISQHDSLGEALAAYDLIGFQTRRDTGSFLDYAQRHLGGRILNDGRIRLGDRTIRCGSFPIGIDTTEFAERAADSEHREEERRAFPSERMSHIIGVDRLDYTKGLLQRFEAFSKFLANHPEHHGKVDFLQIAPPTRQGLHIYQDIRDDIARMAGSINGRYGDLEWTPVRYLHKPFPRDRLAGLYRDAKVGLVTPIQDGMNLVAKEYVAAQDPDDPGVLVLSKFAGAAEMMKGALIINPYDTDQLAAAIARALNMSREERVKRYRSLYGEIDKHDIHDWGRTFIREMEANAALRLADDHKRNAAYDVLLKMTTPVQLAKPPMTAPRKAGNPDALRPGGAPVAPGPVAGEPLNGETEAKGTT